MLLILMEIWLVEAGGVVPKPRVENTELADSIIAYIA